MLAPKLLTFSGLVRLAIAAPPNFPKSGNGLWYNTPGTSWVTDYLPVGNGYLAGAQDLLTYRAESIDGYRLRQL